MTHGDCGLETHAHFLAAEEHRLVPAWAGNEAERLKRASLWSLWALLVKNLVMLGMLGLEL